MDSVVRWRRPADEHRLPAEHVAGAIRGGLRYLRFAPAPSSSGMSTLFALLPTIGRTRLGLGPSQYGLLFGALGVGAVVATVVVPRVRARLGLDALVALSSLTMVALLAGMAVFRDPLPIYGLMALAGVGQMGVMSSFNLAAQSALPDWVRGRGLALYTLVFQLAIAAGAIVWGAAASAFGLSIALLTAAGVVAASNVLALRFALAGAVDRDMTPVRWPEPQVTVTSDPDDGPVLITAEWRIDPIERAAFAAAMATLRRARRRDGAVRHGIWYDLNDPCRVVESYIVQSWGEHLRQRERATGADRQAWLTARAFHRGNEGVAVGWHLLLRPDLVGSPRDLPD